MKIRISPSITIWSAGLMKSCTAPKKAEATGLFYRSIWDGGQTNLEQAAVQNCAGRAACSHDKNWIHMDFPQEKQRSGKEQDSF